jgi:hypothetical protein
MRVRVSGSMIDTFFFSATISAPRPENDFSTKQSARLGKQRIIKKKTPNKQTNKQTKRQLREFKARNREKFQIGVQQAYYIPNFNA